MILDLIRSRSVSLVGSLELFLPSIIIYIHTFLSTNTRSISCQIPILRLNSAIASRGVQVYGPSSGLSDPKQPGTLKYGRRVLISAWTGTHPSHQRTFSNISQKARKWREQYRRSSTFAQPSGDLGEPRHSGIIGFQSKEIMFH